MGDPQANVSNEIKEVDSDSNDTKFTTHPSSASSSKSFSLGEFVFGGTGYFGKYAANQRNFRLQQCMELQLALEDCEKRLRRRNARAAVRAAKAVGEPSSSVSSLSSSDTGWNRWFSSGSNGDTTVGTDETDILRKKKKKKKEKKNGKSSAPRIEETKSGKKISLFYDWGLTGRGGAGPTATSTAADVVGVGVGVGTVVNEPVDNTIEKTTTSTASKVRMNTKSCSMEHHAVWACRAMALGCAPDLMKLRDCFKNDLGTTNPEGCHYENGDDGDGTEQGRCRLEQRIVAQCVMRGEMELKDRLDG